MIDPLILPILIGMFNAGLFKASQPDYILHGFSKWSERALPMELDTALIGCVTCMASFWGTAIFGVYLLTFGSLSVAWWPVIVGMSAFTGTAFYKIIG